MAVGKKNEWFQYRTGFEVQSQKGGFGLKIQLLQFSLGVEEDNNRGYDLDVGFSLVPAKDAQAPAL